MFIATDNHSPLVRIAVFYDGSFFMAVSNYYRYAHIRKANLTFTGFQEFVRHKVAEKEQSDVVFCQIVESHFFRGRFSLTAAKAANVETVIKYCRSFGKVAAIGHSSGGRLCLVSSADFAIGISPALNTAYSAETQPLINDLRSYRVRETYSGVNFEVLKRLPVPQRIDDTRTLILFGSRDVPEIVSSCKELKAKGNRIVEIDRALHSDIFLLEETFGHVVKKLAEWFGNE